MIPIKKWDTIYVLLDLHGTVMPNGLHSPVQYRFINHTCKEVLQWFSKRKDIKLILWTSSYTNETAAVLEWLEKNGVIIDYVNCNPDCEDTNIACFDKKPYYNILIDDRAGFDPEDDWQFIQMLLEQLGEWDKV